MARMSIYVSDSLKADMDRFGDQANWSNIAQSAFSKEIARLNEEPTMEDVIKRLADSKKQELDDGREEGRNWAMKEASYKDLKRLSKLDFDEVASPEWGRTSAYVIAEHMSPEGWEDNPRDNFWYYQVDDHDDVSDEFAQGFYEGAMEVWGQVKDKL